MKKLIFHKQNGAVVLRTLHEAFQVVHSEIVVRFVYADEKLQKKLVETVRQELIARGEIEEDPDAK